MRILCFGASITQGFYDSEGGWVDRLKRDEMARRIAGERDLTVFNLAVSGADSRDILRRIHDEIVPRVWGGQELMVIISVGTNDSSIDHGKEHIPVDTYEQNLRRIVQVVKEFTPKIMFVELPPCDETRTTPVAWGDYHYTNARIRQYNNVMRTVADECGVEMVDIYDMFEAAQAQEGDEAEYLFDGLHPNDRGHELIYDAVRKKLEMIL